MLQWKWKKVDGFKVPVGGSMGHDRKRGMWMWRTLVSRWMDGGAMHWDAIHWRRSWLWVENSRFPFWVCFVQDTCVIIKKIWAWRSEEQSGLEIKEAWTYRWYMKLWEWIRLSLDKVEEQKRGRAKTGPETTLILRVREKRSPAGRLRNGQREGNEHRDSMRWKTGFPECSQ